MANLLSTNVSGRLYTSGHVDTNTVGAAFRFYDGSTFRGGLGLDDWAHSGSANDITLYLSTDSSFYVSTSGTKRLRISSGEARFITYSADTNYNIRIQGGDSFSAYYGENATTLYINWNGGATRFGGDTRANGSSYTDGYLYTNYDIRVGEIWGLAGIYRSSGSMLFGVEGGAGWSFRAGNTEKVWIANDGNIYMSWAGAYISTLLDAKQNASTAITTSNIGSQAVTRASYVSSNLWSGDSQNEAVRVFAPAGASASWDGGITGAFRIKLPQRGNNTMWTMKVRIYNYSSNQVSEYTLGNYSYDQGGYNTSAQFTGSANATARPVRFGNQDGVDCVWIGELTDSWSYPVISVIDFTGGFRGGNAASWEDSWNITYVTEFGTVASNISPNTRLATVNTDAVNVGGNAVIHAGNIGSQSVNYATSAGAVYGNQGDSFGLNDTKLYLRTNGDNNHYLWNADDDWEELNAYEGTGFRITGNGGGTGVLYVYGASNGGYTYSPYSFRAPIFYDSDDGGYYLDPNGISVLSTVRILNATSGASLIIGANDASRVYNDNARKGLVVNADYYPHIYVNALSNASNNAHGAVISMTGVLSAGGYRRWGMGIANTDPAALSWGWWDNEPNPHYSVGGSLGYTSTGARMWLNTEGILQTTGSMRAPIFYDSDDTTYYLDPNSNVSGIFAGSVGINNTSPINTAWGTATTTKQLSIDGTSYAVINLLGAGRRYSMGVGDGQFYMCYDNNAGRHNIIVGSDGSAAFATDVRAPIFYDSNDTGYYLNPNSSGVALRISGAIQGNHVGWTGDHNKIQWHSDHMYFQNMRDGFWIFRKSDGAEPFQFHASGYVNIVGSSETPINITGSGHKYLTINPGNGYEAMVRYIGGSGSGWYVGKRTANTLVAGTESFHFYSEAAGASVGGIDTSGNMITTGSMRAPIFYDSQDTTYYCDPNGYSSFWGLAIRGDKGSTSGGNQIFLWDGGDTTTSAIGFKTVAGVWANHGATSGGYNTYFTMDTTNRGWIFRRATVGGSDWTGVNVASISNTGHAQFDGSVRSPIFYDSDDTGYYLNPTSTGSSLVVAGYTKSKFTYRYNSAAGLTGQDHPVKTATGVLATLSGSGGGNEYIIIKTRIPQDSYQMGGFTIDLFAEYNAANAKTTISLGGYWNAESNGGFVGWEYNTTQPNVRPNIQVMRDVTDGSTCFAIQIGKNYPIVVARDLYLGYTSTDIEGWLDWSIFGADDLGGYTNNDTVICRGAMPINAWFGNSYIGENGTYYGTIFYDTNDTSYYVDPNGTSRLHIIKLSTDQWNQTSDGYNRFYFGNNARTYFGSGNGYEFRSAADANIASISNAGDFVAAGDVTAYSDARIKENVHTIENALDKTLQLRGVTYNRTDSEDKSTKVGVIAQEILEVIPEVVKQNDEGMYSVSYGNLTAVLIEAIKEQQKQIDELKEIINGLTK